MRSSFVGTGAVDGIDLELGFTHTAHLLGEFRHERIDGSARDAFTAAGSWPPRSSLSVKLIQRARTLYRWDTRPTTRRLK